MQDTLIFVDSPAIKGREARYEVVCVNTSAIIKSWKLSLFSFEWLDETGNIRKPDDLPMIEHEKYTKIMRLMDQKAAMERPVLGIGVQDNIEIGAGREVFLTLASQGVPNIEVHIPTSSKKEMKQFLVL